MRAFTSSRRAHNCSKASLWCHAASPASAPSPGPRSRPGSRPRSRSDDGRFGFQSAVRPRQGVRLLAKTGLGGKGLGHVKLPGEQQEQVAARLITGRQERRPLAKGIAERPDATAQVQGSPAASQSAVKFRLSQRRCAQKCGPPEVSLKGPRPGPVGRVAWARSLPAPTEPAYTSMAAAREPAWPGE